MQFFAPPGSSPNIPEFLSGGGEMGERIRSFDWSATPLGPVDNWPQSLRTCIRIMLTSRQPIWIGWGKELIKFYNDPYKAIVGGKHPWALGTPASVVWKDIWKDIDPMLRKVMEEDEGIYVESQLLIMERNGYPEETYYTFSYTPIPGDDGKTAGMFCANTDDTDKIISERQLRTLTELGKALTDCRNVQDIFEKTIHTLEDNPQDFPFAYFRTLSDGKASITFASCGVREAGIPQEIDLSQPSTITEIIKTAVATGEPQLYTEMQTHFGPLPTGAWSVPPEKLLVIPVNQSQTENPYCILAVGMNPYRLPDEKYIRFFSLLADQVATAFADVNLLEEERKRAEALAEIDRAKTTFFSNISHEFRTPLTLLLGPVEDLLHDTSIHPDHQARIEVAYRNALRMQKLVNTLLDFSRIEAGRMEGRFTKVHICRLTQDLASTFRSAIEKAGMQLAFDCETVHDDVYVDVDMWEKIVLNLVSNALKYSMKGTIAVSIRQVGDTIEFTIADNGVGIPADQLEKVFDRFHRVENAMGRSGEGTGIGLAMVKELVKLHHGNITVKSRPGEGTTFTVTIPVGKSHLPAEKIADDYSPAASNYAGAFVNEALKWIPEESSIPATRRVNGGKLPTVLLADDNADMRQYVHRLLSAQFDVTVAMDGEDAWHKMQHQTPDLVLTDIMMPKLDGFGLLRKVRAHPVLRHTPVIFLSARAGEEAKVEGLDAGADDYLIKPFTAKELLARVDANIKISRSRITAQKNLENLFQKAPVSIAILKGNPLCIELANDEALADWGKKADEVIGRPWHEVFPELVNEGYPELLQSILQKGERYVGSEVPLTFVKNGKPTLHYFNYVLEPLKDEAGNTTGIMSVGNDVTFSVIARKKIEESESYFRHLADNVPAIIWMTEKDGSCSYLNRSWYETTSQTPEEALGFGWLKASHPEDADNAGKIFANANEQQVPFSILYRLRQKNGTYRWAIDSGRPRFDAEGNFEGFIGTVIDIHEQKLAEEKLKENEEQLTELANAVPQLVWVANDAGDITYYNERITEFDGPMQLENGEWKWEGMVHPDDIQHTQHAWQEAVKNKSVYQAEHRIKTKDGSYRWFLSRALPHKNDEGQVVKWFGTATEIHGAKEYAAILEEEVRKRTRELYELNEMLKQSNQELQQFAHVASHDLKEPLRKIKTFSERLAMDPGNSLTQKSASFLEKVNSASDRMLSMIEGVLQYSVINAGKQNIESVNLNTIMQHIETDLEIPIAQKHASIYYKDLPVIEGSPVLLYQLLYNLVNNSLKFSKGDLPPIIGITSSIYEHDGKPWALLTLEDNGIGFEPQFAEQIFESFSRLHSKDKFEGTGLGLSLCKRIVIRHGGEIEATGSLGEGSRFLIRLPVEQPRNTI